MQRGRKLGLREKALCLVSTKDNRERASTPNFRPVNPGERQFGGLSGELALSSVCMASTPFVTPTLLIQTCGTVRNYRGG